MTKLVKVPTSPPIAMQMNLQGMSPPARQCRCYGLPPALPPFASGPDRTAQHSDRSRARCNALQLP